MSSIPDTLAPRGARGAKARGRRRSPEPPAWIGYAFLAPNLLGFALFTLLPLLFALLIAFTEWDVISGLGAIRFVGLQNFAAILADANFWDSARLTLLYVGLGVPLTTAGGLLLALALNQPLAGRAVLRLVFFIPYVANTVAVAATWILLYHPRFGPINLALSALGIESPPAWLASSTWALPGLVIMTIWQGAGYAAIIYLAALQEIPQDLYEAADLDGASIYDRFRTITLPLLTPTSFFLLVTGFIGTSQAFGMINLMTRGGPGRSTTVLSYYIYQNGFQFYRFGYAAAMAWVMFLAVLLLTLLLWRAQRRAVFYG
ncbi:MAG TPA: sugar ABC transporter permease [Chloroflexaceae bacterium]|nr:sugar ABC transporter permease [Chloroflexaceae bacterium]